MDIPSVSIIIPIYNVAEFLPRCLDSILSQTFQDYELLLVDDGSTDESGIICDEYSKKDKRIRVFHNANGGAGAARKFGIQHSIGQWIAFVDGDDSIPDNSISSLYNIAKSNEHDIIIGTLNLNNRNIFKHNISGTVDQLTYIKSLLLNETSVGPVAKLYRSTLFNGILWEVPKEITNNEDLLMLISICRNVNTVYIAPDIIAYNYIYRDNSASKSIVMPLRYWEMLFSHIRSILKPFWSNITISEAFYTYELRRLYDTNILKGQYVNIDSELVSEIRQNLSPNNLSTYDKMVFKNVMSPSRQIRSYYSHKYFTWLKAIVKKIIHRQ